MIEYILDSHKKYILQITVILQSRSTVRNSNKNKLILCNPVQFL